MSADNANPDRWGEIEDLFNQASELLPPERPAWLRAQTADKDLVAEVESLLACADDSGNTQRELMNRVEGAAATLSTTMFKPADEPVQIDERIGPYRVLELIGRGGMGAVYRAVREDFFRKEVAIKLVRYGMDTALLLARFNQERQMLAELEHPNIAHLLDGNVTEDGRPYLVMEYVRGEPLMEYCSRTRATIRQKLDLFLKVCSAVAYAHSNLIVHRDIKSSNVLVTSEGTPKLLDFGIAKWLDASREGDLAGVPVQILTPDYASPEQLLGRPATTSADVYSLGVVLYELLTGARPWQRNALSSTLLAEVTSHSPERPSARVNTTGRHSPEGDLDDIVLMALHPDAAERYSSVEQFASDIRRYLDGLPVAAHEPSLFYLGAKFVRRNRVAVAAGLLVAVAATWGFIATYQQKQRAERRFQEVRELANTFLFDFYDRIRDIDGATQAREMVVRTALRYLDRLQREAGGNHDLLAELAVAYDRVATAQGDPNNASLGHRGAARESFLKAVALWDQALAADRNSRADRMGLTSTLNTLGNLQIALADLPGAEASEKRALVILQTLPNDPGVIAARAQAEQHLGNLEVARGRVRDSVTHFEHARDGYAEVMRAGPDPATERNVSGNLSALARAETQLGDLEAALKNIQVSVEVSEKNYAKNPQSYAAVRGMYISYQQLGNVLGAQGRPSLEEQPAALEAYEKSLEFALKEAHDDPKNQSAVNDLILGYGKIGDLLAETDPNRSLDFNSRAYELGKQLVKDGPSQKDIQGYYWLSTAIPLERTGRRAEAIAHLRALIADLEAGKPPNAPVNFRLNLADAYGELGAMEGRAGDLAAGRGHLERSLALYQEILNREPAVLSYRLTVADTLALRATLEQEAGDKTAGRQFQSQAVEVWREFNRLSPGSPYAERRQKQAEAVLERLPS